MHPLGIRLVLLLVLPFLPACTSISRQNQTEFDLYQERFREEAFRFGWNFEPIAIWYGDLEQEHRAANLETVAECHPARGLSSPPFVIVNPDRWDRLSESEREVAVFHELGHCLLGKVHSDGIMQPTLLAAREYEVERESFLKALFRGP